MPTPVELLDQAMVLISQARSQLVSPPGNVVTVQPGGDLQAALNAAKLGDTIRLVPGGLYTGNYRLPVVPAGGGVITLTTSGGLPSGRILPTKQITLPMIQAAPSGEPAIRTEVAAHHWSLVGLEVLGNPGGFGDQIRFGDGSAAQSSMDQVPHDLLMDRCYVHGGPAGQKRGIALNSASTNIIDSYISDIKLAGQDSQAICGWNGPGPFLISNCYLEGAGENVLFGGADPAIQTLVPSDITIINSVLTKPMAWRGVWTVKNLFELKNARRVRFENNMLSNCWGPDQGGFGVQLTPRNQDGKAPWSTVEDVVIRANQFAGMAAAVNFLGRDNNFSSQPMRRIQVVANTFAGIDPWAWAGTDKVFQVLAGVDDLTIDHNTVEGVHLGSVLYFDGIPKSNRLAFTNNRYPTSQYGIFGGGSQAGGDPPHAWVDYVNNGTLSGNVVTP